MEGQLGSCVMGSLVRLVKSSRFNATKKGDWEVEAMETCEDTKFWLEWGLVYDVLYCEFSWLPVWDALFCALGDEGGVMCGVGRLTRVPN